MKFSELQLEPSLQSAIEQLGYTETTAIQAAAMPVILKGKDVAGLAQTGTGKTAAFLIPLMDRLLKGRIPQEQLSEEQKTIWSERAYLDWKAQNFVLILVPTRELAEQVYENIVQLGTSSNIRGAAVYGGTGYDKQKEAFRQSVEFIVATPGRLLDLYKENIVDLKQVRAVVFDEADRMFDMGFKDDMKYILSRIPRERHFLVFSATLNFDVLNTAYQFGAEPIEIDVSRDQAKADNVKDEIFHVGHHEKPKYLLSIIKKQNPKQVIIFSNFKNNVERIAQFLSINGVPAVGISSLLSQAQRNRVLEQFKADNEKNILVATDVAARGLDIKGVDLVINYELPNDAESYVHRIGRTGRAGAVGTALSLVCDRDVDSLARVEDYLKHKVDIGWIEDSELVTEFKPMPSEFSDDGGGRSRHGGGGHHGPRDGARREGGFRDRNKDRGNDRGHDKRGDRGGERKQHDAPKAGGEFRRDDSRRKEFPRKDFQRKDSAQPSTAAAANGEHKAKHPRPQQSNNRRPQHNNNNRPHRPAGAPQRPHHAKPKQGSAKPATPPPLMKKVSSFLKKLFS